jgi:hypothetical protein
MIKMKSSMFTLLMARLMPHLKTLSILGLAGFSLGLLSEQALAQAVPVPVSPAQTVQPLYETLGPKAAPAPTVAPAPSPATNLAPATKPALSPANIVTTSDPVTSGVIDENARAEILKTFQHESRAAYAEAQTACKDLPKDQQAVCLAKARIQYDQDMQYAQKRANMGF